MRVVLFFYSMLFLGLLYMTSSVSCQNEFDGEAEFEEFLTPQNNTHGLLGKRKFNLH